jgi:hypothetical protein
MKALIAIFLGLCLTVSGATVSFGQDFKRLQAQIQEYKQWLDALGPKGSRYWMRVDSRGRPHKLYVGKAFFQTDSKTQKLMVETFSSYLAGHPEKLVLIDLFDASTNKPIGELGWGGFTLYPQAGGGSLRANATKR